MSVIRTIVGTVLTKGAGFVITLLVGVALFRTIGAEGKGQVDGLVTWLTLLLLAYPSLEEPQLYLIGRRVCPPAALAANGVLAALLFGGLAIGLFELLAAWSPAWFEYYDRQVDGWRSLDLEALRSLMWIAPLAVMHKVLGSLLQGLKDMRAFNICFLVQNGVLITLVAVLVLVQGRGVDGAVWSYGCAFGAGGLCALAFVARNRELRGARWRPDLAVLGRLIGSGLRIHGGVVAAWVILESDKLIVLRYGDPSELALYVLAVALTGHLRRLIVQPVKEVLGSRLPDMVEDRERMIDAIAQTSRHVILLTLIPGAVLALLGWPLLWVLYGEAAVPAYTPLLLLIPGSILWAAAVMLSYWFIGTNRFFLLTVIGLAVAAANLALNLHFVPTHGMAGAAATSSVCYTLHLGVFAVLIWAVEGVSPGRFLVPRRTDLNVYRQTWEKIMGRLGRSR